MLWNNDDKKEGKNYYRRRMILVGILTLIAAVVKWGLGRWEPGYTTGYMVLVLIFAMGDDVVNAWRYFNRQKIITDNRAYSFNPSGKFEEGPFYVIEVGGFNVLGWSRQSGEGTIVVPKEIVEEQGQHLRVYGSVHSVKFSELDEIARDTINDHGLSDPYYQTFEMTTPGLDKIDHLFENVDITKLKDGKYPDKVQNAITRVINKLDEIETRYAELQGTVNKRLEDINNRNSNLEDLNRDTMRDMEAAAKTAKSIEGKGKAQEIKEAIIGSENDEGSE